jgi:hypothetical protein
VNDTPCTLDSSSSSSDLDFSLSPNGGYIRNFIEYLQSQTFEKIESWLTDLRSNMTNPNIFQNHELSPFIETLRQYLRLDFTRPGDVLVIQGWVYINLDSIYTKYKDDMNNRSKGARLQNAEEEKDLEKLIAIELKRQINEQKK